MVNIVNMVKLMFSLGDWFPHMNPYEQVRFLKFGVSPSTVPGTWEPHCITRWLLSRSDPTGASIIVCIKA